MFYIIVKYPSIKNIFEHAFFKGTPNSIIVRVPCHASYFEFVGTTQQKEIYMYIAMSQKRYFNNQQ